MKKLIVLLLLFVVLFIVNTGLVNPAVTPPTGTCECLYDDWQDRYYQGEDNCGPDPCYKGNCVEDDVPDCTCTLQSDWDNQACNICGDATPPAGGFDNGVYYFDTNYGKGDSDDAGGEARCCGDDANEYYVYTGGLIACCDDKLDCPTSGEACVTSGYLYPGDSTRLCRDWSDDWHTCSSGLSYSNTIVSMGGNEYCCMDSDGWKWVGPFCSCGDTQEICNEVCEGDWIDGQEHYTGDSVCCFGSTEANYERVGNLVWPWTGCGTLEEVSDEEGDCFKSEDIEV